MNVRNRTAWAAVSAAAAFLSAGCLSPAPSSPSGDAGTAAGKTDTVTILINSLGLTFPNGLDENNNPYLDYIEKGAGLDVKVILPPLEGYGEKLNMIMSSGNTPDMISAFDDAWVANYARQNALLPLDELIDKFGPDLKKKIPKEAWESVTYDGKIYAIPSMNEIKGIELMYARKDWLDRLGLKPPRTLDEYYQVIRAFAQDDPDGNGKQDTVGLVMTENLGRSAPFFGAFGVQLNQWVERDGKLVYANILPEMREALQFMNRLYREKLLDPEFPLNKKKYMEEKIVSGKAGLFSAAWFDTRGPIEENRKLDPKAEWIPLEFPVGPRGEKGVYSVPLARAFQVVPASSRRGEQVVRLLNFLAGEGHRTVKLGFENEIWKRVDGKMVTNFEEHDRQLYRGMYSALMDLEEPEMSRERLDSLGERFHLYENTQRIDANLITDAFQGLPTPSMSRYNAKLLALQDVFTKIVVGAVPITAFDTYVERWKAEGGDQITKEVNEWYRKADK
ncbi:lipoprotein LipO [Paenibacillus sp. J31TS4]|uniref:extracellular solute-binding protein n=1 Tax=Paenibacillus sp. J31TS4 TaxID=2807195 RepID=UPI001B0805E8|nr:extracellular solute-binding protein [Paenibacillus sp. J31TS4]GIP37682.1 lipoprotein LipO [Paenibacillus sp. J31TS4]